MTFAERERERQRERKRKSEKSKKKRFNAFVGICEWMTNGLKIDKYKVNLI